MKAAIQNRDRILLFAALLLLIFLCFYRLGADEVLGFDEGRHGVNALEMYRSGEWIVTTYNGEADYFNLKPPLSTYLIMLGYRLFGVGKLGLRFFSAVCYLLTAVLAARFVRKRSDDLAAAFCLFLFAGSKSLLLNSCARTGDANAVYNLFFLVAMLSLFQLVEYKKQEVSNSLLCCVFIGLGFSLAFLSKSYHAMLIPAIVFFTFLWERLFRKLKFKEWAALIGASVLPTGLWAVLRYQKDGTVFFREMLFTDVFLRTKEQIAGMESTPLYYVTNLPREFSVLAALFLLGFSLLLAFYRSEKIERRNKGIYLLVLLPILLYSIPKTRLITYVYPAVIGLYIWGSLAFHSLRKQKLTGAVRYIRMAGFGIVLLALTLNITATIRIEHSLHSSEFETLIKENRELLSGEGNLYSNQINAYYNTWFQDELFYVEMYTTLHCADGSIEAFRQDKGNASLILYRYASGWEKFTLMPGEELLYENELYRIVKKEGF